MKLVQADFDVCIDCGALDECPHDEMDSINTVKKVDTAESTNVSLVIHMTVLLDLGLENKHL